MHRQQGMPLTPGEIAEGLQFWRSTVQEILESFDDYGILLRFESPPVSIPPSIASLPPTHRVKSITRRTVSSPRGEKPYRLNERGERLAQLMKILDKQLALPAGDQEHELKDDKVFMAKLKSFGFNEEDIKAAQEVGVLNHRKVKVVTVRHRTDAGYATPASIVEALKPQTGYVAIRHRYRIA
jgi:hypothetical protein